MYKTKIIIPSACKIAMMIRRNLMPPNNMYETVKSTIQKMDDSYEHVLEYGSY